MAAALAAKESGIQDILLLERDQYLGGILNQCIHPGFGLRQFKTDLTGPEFADKYIQQIEKTPEIQVSLQTFVIRLEIQTVGATGRSPLLTCIKPGKLFTLSAKAVIMCTGCRERTREMIPIPGTRPAGIFTAGLAQKLINLEGLLPGRKVVIIGSGDIGLIMARRFSLEGAKVKAVIEIQKQIRGLLRNVVQCLEDFHIPLYLQHKVTKIEGQDRVSQVTICRVDDRFQAIPGTQFEIPCDTVLISVGLIPENELLEMAGVRLDKKTNTPVHQQLNHTSIPGVFVCGNAFQIYDLADSVTRDSVQAGKQAADYVRSWA